MSTGSIGPKSAESEQDAARAVQQMFDAIAPKYDVLNHVLSAGIDRRWWNRASKTFQATLARSEAKVLDLCCGTGDMTAALLALRPAKGEQMLAVDFSHEMIVRGMQKLSGANVRFVEADALNLPVESGSLDLVVSAFGFRNLANYEAGLREIARVLKPGGEIGILDFNQPGGLIGEMYSFYFHRILPVVGAVISRSLSAYRYLPESVVRFPKPEVTVQMMRDAGFDEASWTSYTFGIAGLYRGRKAH